MASYTISLFGKLQVRRGDRSVELEAAKVQELLCYLMLFRDRPHPRECIASVLWDDQTTARSKQYLRKALWQLQAALCEEHVSESKRLFSVSPEWVEVNEHATVWLDVCEFEQSCLATRGIPGEAMNPAAADQLARAVGLYHADLLDGWYQEWCLIERERLQHLLLCALDKLMAYHEHRGAYEEGVGYGQHILRFDRAREHTHCALMRLYATAGDRARALRQYDRCVQALHDELDVPPADMTVQLYEQIRTGHFPSSATIAPAPSLPPPQLQDVAQHLHALRAALAQLTAQVEQEIAAIETLLP
jgi:DNA-binding SARP family transcriptional activator